MGQCLSSSCCFSQPHGRVVPYVKVAGSMRILSCPRFPGGELQGQWSYRGRETPSHIHFLRGQSHTELSGHSSVPCVTLQCWGDMQGRQAAGTGYRMETCLDGNVTKTRACPLPHQPPRPYLLPSLLLQEPHGLLGGQSGQIRSSHTDMKSSVVSIFQLFGGRGVWCSTRS